MKPCAFETERTNQGEQTLVPGVKPIRDRDRLQVLMEAPLAPKRAQKPCNVGLFDEDARTGFLHSQPKKGNMRMKLLTKEIRERLLKNGRIRQQLAEDGRADPATPERSSSFAEARADFLPMV